MPDVPAQLRRRRFTAVCAAAAAAALLVGGLTGCDPEQPTPPPTTPPVSSPTPTANTPSATPTPSPTPSPTSKRDREEAAVKHALRAYYQTRSKLSMDPKADVDLLRAVAIGELLETELGTQREWRAKGWRATKAVQIENLMVVGISVESNPPTATVSYCANSTGVDVVDRNGKSQVAKDRPDHFSQEVQLVKQSNGTWLPHQMRTRGDACD